MQYHINLLDSLQFVAQGIWLVLCRCRACIPTDTRGSDAQGIVLYHIAYCFIIRHTYNAYIPGFCYCMCLGRLWQVDVSFCRVCMCSVVDLYM